jgi:NADH-quinone oxidoreductase subunit M
MENYNILSVLQTVPLAAGLIAWVIPKTVQRMYAIFASAIIFALSIYIAFQAQGGLGNGVMEQKLQWLPALGISLSFRLDSISLWFVIFNGLTALIAFSVKGPWYRKNARLFTSLGFFLIFALNTAFLSTDLIMFYLAYEAVFIPMIFMVGMWGDHAKASSVFRFFLMSFLGSILMLVSILALMHLCKEQTGHYSGNVFDLIQLAQNPDATYMRWCFVGFFLAFAIKVPIFPFHGWLKSVYVNAPMPATIWLSAILSKLGVFGFLRFVTPLFSESMHEYQGVLLALSAFTIIYAAFLAMRAREPKTLLSYSSISHLGFVMLGVFALNAAGATAAILLSIGHTIVSASLFYALYLIEERVGDISLDERHGLAKTYPILFTCLFVLVLGSVSLPGTMNFVGEFGVLLNSYSASALCTIIGAVGVIFGAVYMLRFYQQLGFGKSEIRHSRAIAPISAGDESRGHETKDLAGYDFILLWALVLSLIYFGFQPNLFLKG